MHPGHIAGRGSNCASNMLKPLWPGVHSPSLGLPTWWQGCGPWFFSRNWLRCSTGWCPTRSCCAGVTTPVLPRRIWWLMRWEISALHQLGVDLPEAYCVQMAIMNFPKFCALAKCRHPRIRVFIALFDWYCSFSIFGDLEAFSYCPLSYPFYFKQHIDSLETINHLNLKETWTARKYCRGIATIS